MEPHETVRVGSALAPGARRRGVIAPQTGGRGTSLPADVVADAARRLRAVALLYATVFFIVGPVTALSSGPAERHAFFTNVLRVGPSLLSILTALVVAASTHPRANLSSRSVLTIGLLFEVAGSYGIAAARYLDPAQPTFAPPGVSWVAVWILLFATTIPNPPRQALAAAIASATAVPVTAVISAALRGGLPPLGVWSLGLQLFLPYLLVALVAYAAARVVYRLGTALSHARELGSYRLVERLGQGGMGEVWRADHQLLARPAAIKLIRGAASDPEAAELIARFEREAQVTSSLRSPHTIQLYDFGVADDGAFYYVMELLDGVDLHALVERFGPVPIERAIHLLVQVCESLAEAHERGLVHRDVKPANVYVCRYGREVDFIKVLDFGLVKPVDSGVLDATQPEISAVHAARGTPAFMAPEQALGNRSLDSRTDLYAVGCLAYWLVTARPVFTGATPIDTIVKQVHAIPEPPSRHAPVSAEFDDIVLSCLAKDPDERPPTADALAARLRSIWTGQAWMPDRARAWWETHLPAPPPRHS
jgi:serine/threonine-protein kinase